jgi:uncharacterized protein (TIGR02444 family)
MPDDNDLWRFSLRVYAAQGVAQECLAVQDRYGSDINLLLFCAWLGAERNIALTPDELGACERAVSEWHQRAVRPLRDARRALKDLAGAEDIRAQVKTLELDAEKHEQEILYAFAMQRWPARGSAQAREALRNNVGLFLMAHGAPGLDSVSALLAAAAG